MDKVSDATFNPLPAPKLTRTRIRFALIVAIAADLLQWCLGQLGWAGPDQAIYIVAMICTIWLIGFHPLLLPTVLLELIPGANWLPSWTGCVLLVISRRKKQEAAERAPQPVIVDSPPMLEA